MESKINTLNAVGTIRSTDVYKLLLKCIPAQIAGRKGDKYICEKFTVTIDNSPEVRIPVLEQWSYVYNVNKNYRDETSYVLGIDHRPFENLIDAEGNIVPQDKAYHVYNAFIDYHALCTVFPERTSSGNGIQDLERIGQKIVHTSSFSKPEVSVNTLVSEGSYFQNGEVTLEFKGIGLYRDAPCAIVGYDSGASRFAMMMEPSPGIEVQTNGSSHYKGDIYKNLKTNWVEKVILEEIVVSETIIPGPSTAIDAVSERNITILNISQDEFDLMAKIHPIKLQQ
ncbi:MAG: hypothetical protein M1415_05080 [Firmicutes bacterium]|jgi:hypothetical protein|nr:hypothetical protein [Bacillota bacterium]